MFGKKRERFRHVIRRKKGRKPLTRRDTLLRLREIYEILDVKRATVLTQADIEMIDYNFALANLYDRLSGRGEVQAIGFEADIGGEEYEEDEE